MLELLQVIAVLTTILLLFVFGGRLYSEEHPIKDHKIMSVVTAAGVIFCIAITNKTDHDETPPMAETAVTTVSVNTYHQNTTVTYSTTV